EIEVSDGRASAERAWIVLDLAEASATDRLKLGMAVAQVIIVLANKRRALILDESNSVAVKERNKLVSKDLAVIDAEGLRYREELRKLV
ncbi:F0F1 ATP synthase subunit B, partial [Erwinia amylovora]|nr:F0F1 ATP synthase subunit B [Erwinia amylovora]